MGDNYCNEPAFSKRRLDSIEQSIDRLADDLIEGVDASLIGDNDIAAILEFAKIGLAVQRRESVGVTRKGQ